MRTESHHSTSSGEGWGWGWGACLEEQGAYHLRRQALVQPAQATRRPHPPQRTHNPPALLLTTTPPAQKGAKANRQS